MRAGLLDRLVQIQMPNTTTGTYGELTNIWTTLASAWAQYKPVSGRENMDFGEKMNPVDAIWKIRYMAGITPAGRILDEDGNDWRIQAVLVQGRKEWIELHCEAFYA